MKGWRLDAVLIGAVLLAAAGVKGWLFAHSPVIARDGIDFIQYATYLEQERWIDVFRESPQHPLYPLHVHVLSQLVPSTSAEPITVHWQRLAQLASLIAGLLLAPLTYFLGKRLFDRRVGFSTALLLQVLPAPALITVDALSEGTFLLYFTATLLLAVAGVQKGGWGWFFAAGIAAALTYLTRPEGLVLAAVTLGVVFALWLFRAWEASGRRAAACSTAFSLGLCGTAAPYWVTIGGLSNKPSTEHMMQAADPLFASRFMPGTDGHENVTINAWYALHELIKELGQAHLYVLWLPALLGMVWYGYGWRIRPARLLPLSFCSVYFFVLWRLAATAQYVSERHVLPILVCGTVFAVAILFDLAEAWASHRQRREESACREGEEPASPPPRLGHGGKLALGLVLLVGVAACGKTLKPLHGQQLPHRLAGEWLARHSSGSERLVDPYGLATYYSGRALAHLQPGAPAPVASTHRFMIVETDDRDLHRTRLFDEERQALGEGDAVFTWPPNRPKVIIYRAAERAGYPPSPPERSRYLRRHR